MEEIWKPVKGFEGIYDVSNFGRVKELHPRKYHRAGKLEKDGSWIVTQDTLAFGYKVVRLRFSPRSKIKRATVHSLVMESFVGPRPDGKDINHMDLDPANNRLDNLEYVSRRENINHANTMYGTFSPHGTGVVKEGGLYRACIVIHGETKRIGSFATSCQAHRAYATEAKRLGQTRYINEPNSA